MSHPGLLEVLTEEERAEIIQGFQLKLAKAEQELTSLEEALATLRSNMDRWRVFISQSIASSPIQSQTPSLTNNSSPKSPSKYNKQWTKVEKTMYALQNPQAIGKHTLAGGAEVLEVLLIDEPELLANKPLPRMQKQFRGVVSGLASEGKVMKLREKQNKNAVHYLHPSWFENGSLKAEYRFLLKELEPIPQKKHGPR